MQTSGDLKCDYLMLITDTLEGKQKSEELAEQSHVGNEFGKGNRHPVFKRRCVTGFDGETKLKKLHQDCL